MLPQILYFIKIKFIRILRLRIAEIEENAKLKFHQDLECLYI